MIDKWVIMKILQSKGIISFDEDNYKQMNVDYLPSRRGIIVLFEGHVTEFIDIDSYKQIIRESKIDKVLKS